jgi:hypothetical protein
MATVNTQVANIFTRRTVQLFRFDAKVRAEVRRQLEKLERQLLADLQQFDPTAVERLTYRQQRIIALEKQVRQTLRENLRGAQTLLAGNMRDLALDTALQTREAIKGIMGVDLMTVSVPENVLRTLATKSFIHGTPAKDYWQRIAVGTQRRFMDHVRLGVMRGDGIDVMRRSWQKQGRIGATFTDAEKLIRTATLAVHNQANAEVFAANDDVVRGVAALVTFDLRTSEICMARAGGAWNQETGNPLPESTTSEPYPGEPPWHFNCRTVLIPVLKSLRQITGRKKASLIQLPEAMRSSMDGQVPASTTMDQFLQSRPFDDVVGMLGRTKAEAWRDGELQLSQLIDQTGRPATLDQLGLAPAQGA